MKRIVIGLAMLAGLAVLGQWAVPAAGEEKKDNDGWVQLFNGKDLKGWKTHEKNPGQWKVEDGLLIGSGPVSHLFSERGDYKNFHYRVEAMINDKGNSGQYSRTEFGPGFPLGLEAQINSTHSDKIRTGSLYPDYRVPYTADEKKKMIILEQLHKPDEWFTQEVIAKGDHIVIKVNGKTAVDITLDPKKARVDGGHFALQQHDPGSVVKFRKIEVKELPASKPEEK